MEFFVLAGLTGIIGWIFQLLPIILLIMTVAILYKIMTHLRESERMPVCGPGPDAQPVGEPNFRTHIAVEVIAPTQEIELGDDAELIPDHHDIAVYVREHRIGYISTKDCRMVRGYWMYGGLVKAHVSSTKDGLTQNGLRLELCFYRGWEEATTNEQPNI
jgi:hypothetical protein